MSVVNRSTLVNLSASLQGLIIWITCRQGEAKIDFLKGFISRFNILNPYIQGHPSHSLTNQKG